MMPVAQGNKWLMDGIIKIDSKLISVPLLKMKSPESISLVMGTFCKASMTCQALLFVYGFANTSGSAGTDFPGTETMMERGNTLDTAQTEPASSRKHTAHDAGLEGFVDILSDAVLSMISSQGNSYR